MGGMGGMDPQQMSAMLQDPMMQQMMQRMMADPQAMERMAAMDPQLSQAMQNPQMRAMMTNPDFLRQMSDPNFMAQAMQMRQAMGGMGFNPFMFPPGGPTGGGYGAPAPGLNFSSLFAAPGAVPGTLGALGVPPPPVPVVDPAVQYASQLQQLQDMGFSDAPANLQALVHTRGNVNNAVERLLGGP